MRVLPEFGTRETEPTYAQPASSNRKARAAQRGRVESGRPSEQCATASRSRRILANGRVAPAAVYQAPIRSRRAPRLSRISAAPVSSTGERDGDNRDDKETDA